MSSRLGSTGLRLSSALAHTVPGAVLQLADVEGGSWIVAHHRPDAAINPCTLRAALLGRIDGCDIPFAE